MDFMKRAASMLFDIKRLRLQGCFRANSLIFWEDSLDDSDYKDRSHLLISSSRLNFWYYIIFLIEEFKEMKYKIVNYEYRETAWIKWGLFPMSRKDLKVEIWNIFFFNNQSFKIEVNQMEIHMKVTRRTPQDVYTQYCRFLWTFTHIC